jgi:type VI protein secretion system component VasK
MIWTLVAGWIARRGVMMGVIAAIGAGVLFWDHRRAERHREEGKKEVVQASKKEGKRRNAEVRKIRRSVPTGGAWKRLRKEYGRSD